MTVRVTADGKEIATKQFKGQVPVKLSATGLNAEVLERNKVELSATISNETVLAANERTAAYGYIDSDGNQVELGTVTVEGLEPGASTEFSVELDQDFATFESKVLDDGSLRDSRRYYLDLEPESKAAKTEAAATDEGVIDEGDNSATIVYGEIALTATASQVSLMGKAKNLGAKLAIDDGEGGVKAVEAVRRRASMPNWRSPWMACWLKIPRSSSTATRSCGTRLTTISPRLSVTARSLPRRAAPSS